MINHYIITGPGRTGSHWVEQIVKVVDPRATIDHNNRIQYLLDQPDTIKQSAVLLVCHRHDVFASAISYFVAKHINEWFAYTNQTVNPFAVDVTLFQDKLIGIRQWHEHLNFTARLQFNQVVDVWFEDLVSTHPETYIGNLLGIDAKSLTYNWNRNKNPRDYSKLVANYQELREIYLQNQ